MACNKLEYAFPVVPHTSIASYGMSLRDYFAASAMNAYIVGKYKVYGADSYPDESIIAGWAYKLADAMLKEREK